MEPAAPAPSAAAPPWEPYPDLPLWRRRLQRLRYVAQHVGPESAGELVAERLRRRDERRMLLEARAGRDVCWEDEGEDEPLVTVRIATYNRGPLLAERAIRSALEQTYRNLEILVIGDSCDAATAAAATGVDDPRVRFVNLPRRGLYPLKPLQRWMVAGATPMNVGLELARGSWIAPCDDDDELTPDHVETLLRHARDSRAELVWSRALMQSEDGSWRVTQGPPLREGQISHGSVLYSTSLRFVRHSTTCWKLGEPADWNMWRRMRGIGVRISFLDQVTYKHY